ncbi:hypothetical protein [Streptomyces lichenis]|uniref:Lipoprotein n=1 Tax=Streptomyces lichenis TaxID=2306967 RepID=A0ABT0I5X7_9ACTN|nr:hypothetical protein [Streptomyces lichenis]MCK8676730.1 hypothetical protein [Streptomyces lichenis]
MALRAAYPLGIACAVLLAGSTACTSDSAPAASAQQTSKPATSAAGQPPTASPEATPQPSVDVLPELDADETSAGSKEASRGNGTVDFGKGKKGEALIVAVRCQGAGKINVLVQPMDVTFPLQCEEGQVSTTYNQVAVGGTEAGGEVSVRAPRTIRWSLVVGRGEPATSEPPAKQ